MNLELYRRSSRYAQVLTRQNSKDIVHDAYLSWFDKKGTDLFDQSPKVVFGVIKNTFLNNLKKDHRYWTFRGERLMTTVKSFEDQVFTSSNPESELIAKEVKKNCAQKVQKAAEASNSRINGLKSRLDEVYELLVKGYALFEIALLLGLTRQSVSHYSNQLRTI